MQENRRVALRELARSSYRSYGWRSACRNYDLSLIRTDDGLTAAQLKNTVDGGGSLVETPARASTVAKSYHKEI